jgi:tRNA threonylcarbamoyladenosine biosynthesis protein TsaE
MGEYHGRLTLYHADLYRLDDPEQVLELGLEEVSRDGVLAVEWPERAGGAPAEEYLLVRFEVVSETERRMTAEGAGERGEALARAFG